MPNQVVTAITSELESGSSTRSVYRKAFKLLSHHTDGVAARYSLKKAIAGLGPSGFPFEDFLARIFQMKGYRAETGVTLAGHCVPHEIDVLAIKDNEIILVEAKFHNDDSLNSDTKDVMYIKSRWDDLRDKDFEFSGTNYHMTKGMLITNTKFSSGAVAFASCKGMEIMGWSYPRQNSLQQWIEKSGLHPLTCLTTLSSAQKKILIERGLILCREILHAPENLDSVGVNEQGKAAILKEIAAVMQLCTTNNC